MSPVYEGTQGPDVIPIQRSGLRVEVAESLRRAIFNASLKPGDQIRETEMAAKIGVSRGSLREALLELEKGGLVEIKPNRGAFIRTITSEEMAEIPSLRIPLETMAPMHARLRMTRQILDHLRTSFANMSAIAKSGRIRRLIKEEFEFHKSIWAASGHSLLNQTLIRLCTPWFAFAETIYSSSTLDFSEDVESHRPFIEFLAGTTQLTSLECQRLHFGIMKQPLAVLLKVSLEEMFASQSELLR